MKNKTITLLSTLTFSTAIFVQTWIWYPGDHKMWFDNKMNNRRTKRGAFLPPFWKTDSHFVVVEFSKQLNLPQPEEIEIAAEGIFNIKLDGELQFGTSTRLKLPAGVYSLNIKVWNQAASPTIFVNGKTVKSDCTWRVTCEDKEWIDENEKASDASAIAYLDADCWDFNTEDQRPSLYQLSRKPVEAVMSERKRDGILYDSGHETFGYLVLKQLKGSGTVNVYYGESSEEASDTEHCETLGRVLFSTVDNYIFSTSKVFRYIYVVTDKGISVNHIEMDYGYAPVDYRGSFRCNSKEMNRTWEVGTYATHLTTCEFLIDGVKRDRWVWSGDAIQSYLMNYYLFFDSPIVRRTIYLFRGKGPITSHTDTIMNHIFFWFLSVYDYYLYIGDHHFASQLYPRMQTMMDYVLGRTNKNGMVEGMTDDQVSVDWADGYLDKRGELPSEQVLLCKGLETMSPCVDLVGCAQDTEKYNNLATDLHEKLLPAFWNEKKQALAHNRRNGQQSESITCYSNMLSIFFGYLDQSKQQAIKHSVLLDDSILKITTPYTCFYELEALCSMGMQAEVLKEIKAYWGEMLRKGTTSSWEKCNPEESGTQHLAIHGCPYGKSLCYAWGVSPIYSLGKYYLGVKPTKPGYAEYAISPCLGGLEWMEGAAPTPQGDIYVYMDQKKIRVKSLSGKGYLSIPSPKGIKVVEIPAGKEVEFKY